LTTETALLKKEIVNLLEKSEDAQVLSMIHTLLEQSYQSQTPIWDELDNSEKQAMNEGILQLEAGRGIAHEDVLARVKQKFSTK
jgi:predicted transcriptional regulator